MKPVFLSASEPNPNRSREYWDSRKLVAVREAVRAVVAYVLRRQPLVFGGHPAITPLVRAMAARVHHDGAEPRIPLFLSQHFRARFPAGVADFSRHGPHRRGGHTQNAFRHRHHGQPGR